MRMIAATAVLASLIAACNLLAGLNEDYRYEADGAAPPNDGGGDGGPADGALDGVVPPVDASDAAVTKPFCDTADAGPKGYCDDFEKSPPALPFGWSDSERDVDAGIAVVADAGMDHSHGLTIVLAQTSTSNNTAWLVKKVGIQAADTFVKYELAFDFNVVAIDGIYSADLAMLTFPSSAQPEREFGIAQYGTGTAISRLSTQGSMGAPVVFGKWMHADVVLERTPPATTFTKTIIVSTDGSPVTVDTGTGISAGSSQDTEIRVGIFSTAAGAGSISMQFDNVLLRRW
jgi:hypothetical protein